MKFVAGLLSIAIGCTSDGVLPQALSIFNLILKELLKDVEFLPQEPVVKVYGKYN